MYKNINLPINNQFGIQQNFNLTADILINAVSEHQS